MEDLVSVANEIMNKTISQEEYRKLFFKKLKEELLHMEDSELNSLTCVADIKARQYVITLRIDFPSDEINSIGS